MLLGRRLKLRNNDIILMMTSRGALKLIGNDISVGSVRLVLNECKSSCICSMCCYLCML